MRLQASIILLLLAGPLCGQTHPFLRYGAAEGLPENHVTAVTVDHRGFLWAGTAGRGLARFDGQTFVHFGGRETGMFGGVFALAADGNRWLFAGGNDGVHALLLDDCAADRADTAITRLLRPVRGSVRTLRMRRDRRLYIETVQGAWLFRLRDSTLARCAREAAPFDALRKRLPGMTLRGMARDCRGDAWVATDSGLALLTDTQRYLFGPPQGLPTRGLTGVCIDHEAGIWCGSIDGLYHYVPQRFFSVGLGDSAAVSCMLESRDRAMYFGTRGRGFVRLFDGPRREITMRDGLPSNTVTALHELPTGEILVATDNGVVVWGAQGELPMPETLHLPDPRVAQVHHAADRSYWFATAGGLVQWDGERSTLYGTRDGLPSANITCLAEDAYGYVIAGTPRGAARVRATGGGTVTPIPELHGVCITSLLMDRKDRLWIGSVGDGVIVRIDGVYHRLGSAQGLAGGNIASIGVDNYGSLYFGHNRGISVLPQENIQYLLPVDSAITHWGRVPPAQLPFMRAMSMFPLTADMGLAAGELQDRSILRDRAGRMWFGGSAGASSYNPARPPSVGGWVPPLCRRNDGAAPDALPMRVLLAELCIDDTCTELRESVALGADQRVLRARVLLPTFRNPGQLRFLYQLRGMEYTWHESSDGRILYTGLEPGEYTLVVQATIGEGIWSARQTLVRVEVAPPLQRRWWFLLLLFLAAAGAGMLLQRTLWRWRASVSHHHERTSP